MDTSSVAVVTLDSSERPDIHVNAAAVKTRWTCSHEWVTEAEYLGNYNEVLRNRQSLASAQAVAASKRAAKGTTRFKLAAKDRMDVSWNQIEYVECGWSASNPPFLVTLKTPGSGMAKGGVRVEGLAEKFWIDYAPSYKSLVKMLEQLVAIYELAFGILLNALRLLEFATTGGNPHFHLFMTHPVDAFGSRVRSSFKVTSPYYDLFNGKDLWEFLELVWAYLLTKNSGKVVTADISNPLCKGKVSWVPMQHEVPPAESLQAYVWRFIDYARKGGKNSHKSGQHVAPWQWDAQQINFWGTIGFKGFRGSSSDTVQLECLTIAALHFARSYLHKLSGARRRFKATSDEDSDVMVDASYFSNARDLHHSRGGRINRRLTAREMHVLRRGIAFYNSVSELPQPEEVTVSSNYEELPYGGPFIHPNSIAMRRMTRAARAIPAPWDADDFDHDAYIEWVERVAA